MRSTRKARLVSASLAAAVVATLTPAVSMPAVANAVDVPSFCPAGTVRAETFGADDFDPDTAAGLGSWTADPADSFTTVQDDSGAWLLRGNSPESGWQSHAYAGDDVRIPQGGRLFLAIEHEIESADNDTAMWAFLDGPHKHDFVPFNDANGDRAFLGDFSRRTSYADLSEWRGQRVDLAFTIQKGSLRSTRWDIHDVSFVACYDDEISAPESVRGRPANLWKATVHWQPPAQHPDQVTEYQVHLYDLTNRDKDRTVTVGPDRRSYKFRRLLPGHTYRAAVGVGGRVSTDPRELHGSRVRFDSKMRRVVSFRDYVPFRGRVYCPHGNERTEVTVLLRKKSATSRWRTARRMESRYRNGQPRWDTHIRPARNMRVRAVFRGGAYDLFGSGQADERCMANRTIHNAVIRVRPHIKLLTEGSHYVQYAARRGESVHFSGKVRPYNAGRKVKLQRNVDGEWHVIKRKRLNKKSRFNFWVRPRFDAKYRVVTPPHKRNAWGRSNVTRVVV